MMYRIVLALNSTSWMIVVYGIKSEWDFLAKNRIITSAILLCIPIALSILSIILSKWFKYSGDHITTGRPIVLADNEFLPVYLGYFFVALSVPSVYSLAFVYFIVFVFTFLAQAQYFNPIFVISGVWQSLGWGTILYLAAIAGINPSLYEAAEVDGANHFQRVWHVTIPCILPTITTLLILDIGGLVGSGGAFEKVFLLYNPMTYETADIISTFVFRMGLGSGNYSYATAVGLFEALLNLFLLTIANKVSKKVSGSGLW